MISKQPTIDDIYNFDAYISTPGVREGLMQRATLDDAEFTLEDTDDGQAMFFNTPHGEQMFVGMPEKTMPGRQEGDVLMAAGPSGTTSDAGLGISEMKPIPRNAVVGGVANFVKNVRDMANQYEVKDWVPLLGSLGVGDLLLGKSPEEIENWAYGNSPITMPPSGTGGYVPIVKTGRKEGLADVAMLGIDVAPIGKALTTGVKVATKAGKALAPEAGQLVAKSMEKLGTPLQMNIVETGPNLVSTRLPTAVKKTEDPLTSRLVIDLQAAKQDPVAFSHNMGLIRQYPNFASKARNPDKQAEDFISEVKNNLLFLHDQVPDATRQRSKLWYDGARTITDRFSLDYGVPDQAVSGVLAVLSPQKDWFMNVSLGQRVLDIATKQQSTRWDSSMEAVANTIFSDPKYKPMVDAIRGKTLAEIKGMRPGFKAMWLRTYDQAKNPREHQIVSPEGDYVGLRKNQDGSPTQTGWGSLNEIGKAIVILEDPRLETISTNLGQQHKVRNFYSNIYAPNDPAGPVTIDTHAVAAGLLRPLSGNSREVKHNFGENVKGEVGPKNSSITGVQGTYGIYAEAYRRAAAERGILPREMQSITWEAVRGLYPDTFKSQAKNVDQINGIWLQYRKGKMSLEEARNEVFRNAGGINPPEWEGAGLRSGVASGVQPTNYAGELSGAGIPGGSTPRAGGVQPSARNSASVKRGGAAPTSGAK